MTRNWPVPRVLINVLVVCVAALIGMAVGSASGWPALGSLFGAMGGALAYASLEMLRGLKLLRWLRGAHDEPAPRDTGFWGEMGYRIERMLRRLEQRVDDEQARLQQFLSAIEASPNGVMLLDADDQIEWCSSLCADHFGLDPQRDRRQRVTNLVRSPVFVAYLQSGHFDEPIIVQGARTRSTVSVWVRHYGDSMKLVMSQDVTERERNESMRRDFVANVSHEIRTPLTVIAGFLETMDNLPLSEAERRRVIELMSQQTRRMQALVGDLLTLAQLEGSPRPAADRWVNVQKLLHAVHADAEALSAGRHRFVVDPGPAGQLAGSEAELLSAAGNLLTNAVRYTPAGGTVCVAWSVRGDGSGQLEVQDSGIGIEREHIPRLTERFYRVDGSRSRDTGGTGLGLSIVKHVAQRHGGTLDIHSEPGKGSRFALVFPAVRVRTSEAVLTDQRDPGGAVPSEHRSLVDDRRDPAHDRR